MPYFFVDLVLHRVQVDRLCLFFEIVLIRSEKLFVEGRNHL